MSLTNMMSYLQIIIGTVLSSTEGKDILIIVGGISGLLAFLWKLYDSVWATFLSHLVLELQSERQKNESRQITKITTYVENKGIVSKKIAYAFVLVYPSRMDHVAALQKLSQQQSNAFNELIYYI